MFRKFHEHQIDICKKFKNHQYHFRIGEKRRLQDRIH